MKPFIRTACLFSAVIIGGGALVAPAQAQTDLRGHWAGYGRSATINPGPPNLSFFDVFNQSRGRFSGAIALPGSQRTFSLLGSVGADGKLFALGADGMGNFLITYGRVRNVRPPNPNYPPNPCVVSALRYLSFGQSAADEGFLLFLRDLPDGGVNPGPPGIAGVWAGRFASGKGTPGGGDIQFDLQQDVNGEGRASTAYRGGASFFDVFYPPDPGSPNGSFFDVFFEVQGTVGQPEEQADGSASAPLAMIGVGPGPINSPDFFVAILGGTWSRPGPINGPTGIGGAYALYGSFFDVFFDVFDGRGTAFDFGTFDTTMGGG